MIYALKETIGYTLVWLKRIHKCRGFGIQSPFVYRFVTRIVNDHRNYPEYKQLTTDGKPADIIQRKLLKLLFRIARLYKPHTIYLKTGNDPWFRTAMAAAGCHTASDSTATEIPCAYDLAVVNPELANMATLTALIDKAQPSSIVCVLHIGRNKRNKAIWHTLYNNKNTCISLDLHWCGLLFFDKSKSKEHFIVNF